MEIKEEGELDYLLKGLPSSDKYEKLNEVVSENTYDSDCNVLGSNETIKNLCKKFLRNINALTNSKNNKKYHKDESLYVIYWILDEIRRNVEPNSRHINGTNINDIVHVGNIYYNKTHSNVLFNNYDFDLEEAKKEKYLHDYFKNYENILDCAQDKCEKYYKYVSSIRDIYYDLQPICFKLRCDYFLYDVKYDPDDVLSTLEKRIQQNSGKENKRTDTVSNGKAEKPESPMSNVDMVIKYMICYKINDKDTTLVRYKCEDPAYRQHTEKVIPSKNIKKMDIYLGSTSEAIQRIPNKGCKKVYDNNNKTFYGLNCNKKFEEKGGLIYSENDADTVADSSGNTRHVVDSTRSIDEVLDTERFVPRVKLLSVHRDVENLRGKYENYDSEAIPYIGKEDDLVTFFPEISKEDREKYNYVDSEVPACEYYKFKRNKIFCVNPLKPYDIYKNGDKIDNILTRRGNKLKIIDNRPVLSDMLDKKIIIDNKPVLISTLDENSTSLSFDIFRMITVVAAILGLIFVFFIYVKVIKNDVLIYKQLY
ncbi:VIR-like CYIR protein [Plasmodium cynomolgi strain B]|uniref:VIR-like CYIR protein n=1 Tax=Plasmodium cynomolgi (strain B) TaxID=1120755 RepID=K6UXA4_PLACD|nr:VIR-like CYIR protein [Plasmodium cynomolgi strain B]GAB67075.1 VIR-like CYIR protein [Plasmodium cynomolgi strain B]